MINGAHAIIYSSNPEADKAFLRDVLQLNHVDLGHGWLIFGLPPSEIAIHPGEDAGTQELYFMCGDIRRFIEEMESRSISCTPAIDRGWGTLSELTLPSGAKVGIYEPRPARP